MGKKHLPSFGHVLLTFVLLPIIVIFGIYVILNGHISPGGGFSGGEIIGAGLILYANAFGFEKLSRFFTEKTYKWVSFSALTFYCLTKSYSPPRQCGRYHQLRLAPAAAYLCGHRGVRFRQRTDAFLDHPAVSAVSHPGFG